MEPSCEQWEEAISARADGEDLGVDPAALDAHLRRCSSCRAYASAVAVGVDLGRVDLVDVALGRAPDVDPELAPRLTALVAEADRLRVPTVARWGLLVLAAQLAVLAVAEIVASPEGHESRHVGSFSLAYAIALVVVAVRPARARTVLPVSIVLAGALAITALVDTLRGSAAWATELLHLPEVASVGLVWLLSRRTSPAAASVPTSSDEPPRLRVVGGPPGDRPGSDPVAGHTAGLDRREAARPSRWGRRP